MKVVRNVMGVTSRDWKIRRGIFRRGTIRRETLRCKEISSCDNSPYDFLAVGHFAVFFAVQTFRRADISP